MRLPRYLVLLLLVALPACTGLPSLRDPAAGQGRARRRIRTIGGSSPSMAESTPIPCSRPISTASSVELAQAAGTSPVRATILDTPRINAFAQDGRSGSGFLYVTRGLLALAGSGSGIGKRSGA